MRHDIQHHIIGVAHRFLTYACEVTDGLVDIFIDDSLGCRHVFALHGQGGGKDSRGDTGRNLQRTAGLGTVADHAGKIGYHILHGVTDIHVITSHQIGDAATGTDTCHHTAAEGRQRTEALLDVDGGKVTQDERTDEFFPWL